MRLRITVKGHVPPSVRWSQVIFQGQKSRLLRTENHQMTTHNNTNNNHKWVMKFSHWMYPTVPLSPWNCSLNRFCDTLSFSWAVLKRLRDKDMALPSCCGDVSGLFHCLVMSDADITFLDATTHFHKRSCLSIRPLVRPLVCPSVRPLVHRSVQCFFLKDKNRGFCRWKVLKWF